MPIYEYKCRKCGAQFEKLVNRTEQQVECEQCGSRRLEKLLSTFSAKTATPATACHSADCGNSCKTAGCCPFQ